MTPTLFDKVFRNENGEIVIGQPPNSPLIAWIIASLLKLLPFNNSTVDLGLGFLAFGTLFTWAWLELFDGVNYFRRVLGLGVLVGLMTSKVLLPQQH